MKRTSIAIAAAALGGAFAFDAIAEGHDGGGEPDLGALARLAATEGPRAEGAAGALRMVGPRGLEALLETHADEVAALRRGERGHEALRRAIDRVSAQRDGHSSGLYWYTDLGRAQAAARELGRPILSLRMLGRLDEERSCANSRFFRLMLYSNERVRRVLAERYVLHWSSERARVPQITVDFGDGRRIESTITGNSIHYVLDPSGRPVDAIPGLYTPNGFANALEQGHGLWRRCGNRAPCIARAHDEARARAQRWWDANRTPRAPAFGMLAAFVGRPPTPGAPSAPARAALPVAITKSAVEGPMLGAFQPGPAEPPAWDQWVPRPPMTFDAGSRGLLRLKMGTRDTAATERRLVALVQTDEIQNEYYNRVRIRERMAAADSATFDALNQWVYAEVFLTPASDPWLGLRDDNPFDGIETE